MSEPNKPKPDAQDDWIEVGQRRAAERANHAAASAPAPSDAPPEERVLARREPTPPGKISLRIGLLAVAVMLALYIFADLREVEMPWARGSQFHIGYVFMLLPALGIVWGLIGLAQRRPGDLRRAALGMVLSLAAAGLGAAAISARNAQPEAAPVISDDRIELSPQDLGKWREEKLRREQ